MKPELPSKIAVYAGHPSAADGTMLMAGTHGAAYHKGSDWHLIINRGFDSGCRANGCHGRYDL
ncbi:hypothetical protein OLZ32_38670 [Rhizobium sp. 1AS11]|uniref:hypothetical protein n=1 Tax=Rhizobium acaciae TaxID=2989736 RepID=UPI002223EA35|nr:hypothetical protein [Rhizobium acaciae]MCW1414106.1 hypothetical protein [Rhizobium acaciae]MCW1746262.1 hypothetical protein [Rhizobium acaciae]